MNNSKIPLFETFQPFLTWNRIIGIFPCKKVKNDDGTISLVPINKAVRFLCFGLHWSIILALSASCWHFVLQRSGLNIFHFARTFHPKGKSIDTALDVYIEQINIFMSMLVGLFLLVEIHLKAKDICAFHQAVSRSYKHNETEYKNVRWTWMKYTTVLSIFNLLFVLLFAYAIASKFQVSLHLDSTNTWLVATAIFLFWGFFFETQFGFYLIFGECVLTIYTWTTALKDGFDENSHVLLQNTHELSKCLKMTSKLFSRCNFYGMLIWLVNMIFIEYRIFSIWFSNEKNAMYASAYVFMGLQQVFFVVNLNVASQVITEMVQVLGKKIKQTNMTEMKIEWNGQWESTSFVKEIVIEDLQEFQGFEGEGYFTLGKSFLSSIVTNFLTYFIILIQLKLTFMTF